MSDYQSLQQYPPAYPRPAETSTLAILSLVAGIAAWVILPVICAFIAIVLGHLARSEVRNSMGRLTGEGLATAGLVLGYLQLGLSLCVLCGALAALTGLFGIAGGARYDSSLLPGLLGLLF